jgi:hypothetical protein
MARYAFGMRATVAGTNLRAQMSLYGIANIGCRLREWEVVNSVTTAFAAALARFTNATGVGAGQAEAEYDENAPAPSCTVFAGHTADSAVGQVFKYTTIGAAAGAGIGWTFGDSGIVIQPGTANGLGLMVPTGTGQIGDHSIAWDE